jgi:CubicO group peptidase (beta-lactamase class C family)
MQAENDMVTADRLAGFDEFARAVREQWQTPGLAIAVVQDDEVVYERAIGVRDVDQHLEVTSQTLFAIASCSKAFTTAALAVLADEGRLDWDLPVREYMPSFRLHDTLATERISARDLVCHRSGLPRHDLLWYSSAKSRSELVHRMRHLEPSADFRSTWQYQNLMYMTAGYLIEQISGQTWEEFVRDRIFAPLGMCDSTLSVEESQQSPDFALPYKKERDDTVHEIPFYSQWAVGPAGGINSSIRDLARWVTMHLNGGRWEGTQLISEGQVREMQTPQMVMPPSDKYPEVLHLSYGLGWFIQGYRGHNLLQHGGNIDGFSSLVTLLPRENIGVVVLTNLNGNPVPWILSMNVCDRLLGLAAAPWNHRAQKDEEKFKEGERRSEEKSDEDRVKDTQPSHPIKCYAGEYEHPGYGTIEFSLREGVMIASYNALELPAFHYHYDTFVLTFERWDQTFKATFSANARGDIESVRIPFEDSVSDITFTRVPDRALRQRGYLERFVGKYDLSGESVTIALKGDGTLLVQLPHRTPMVLVPYKENRFTAQGLSGYELTFVIDAEGQVTEAIITQPGVVQTARRT